MIKSNSRKPNVHKIALSGGPGGGKSTAAELFKREYRDFITLVPEVATLLFKGGFPRVNSPLILEAIQSSIFHVQLNIEDAYATLFPDNTLLCDRGTVDGGAYWPKGPEDFFKTMGTTLQDELMSYDAVIFFETAAAGGLDIDLGNPIRNEDQRKAIEIDLKLKDLWSKHPNFVYIKNETSFLKKTMEGIKNIDQIIRSLKQV
ncbi:MAG: ATP-binding protein [Bacteriovoracaceae bacterium]